MTKPKTVRVTALVQMMTASSVVVPQGTAVDLPTDEAERLIELGHAERGDRPAEIADGKVADPKDDGAAVDPKKKAAGEA